MRIAFFLLLWAVFVVATLHAHAHLFLLPVAELIFGLLTLWFAENLVGSKWGQVFWRIVACVAIGIYLLECIYWAVVGEWISVLAFQNLNQLYLVLSWQRISLLCAAGIVCYVYDRFIRGHDRLPESSRARCAWGGIAVLSLIAIALQNGWLLSSVIHGRATPLVTFTVNLQKSLWVASYGDEVIGYPFEKDWIYDERKELMKRAETTSPPNIILIFMEGTSARLLGCYGGRYSGLTPNIDAFAAQSMRVDNYFNHTAPTFQGTLGQMASCFTSGSWDRDKGLLATRVYQTLPRILSEQYDTVFFHPHKTDDPYTSLLETCGFQNIYTRDTVSNILGYSPQYYYESITDQEMYDVLMQYSSQKGHSHKPFLLAMYTFGTHVGIPLPEGGCSYKGVTENEVLDTLHNCDAAFGKFWEYFKQSPFKDNTIVILTADHAHYYDPLYLSLVSSDNDYTKCFFDRIPLIIYDPTHIWPKTYDAMDATSLALAPTICHILGIRQTKNSFMGRSIFDMEDPQEIQIAGWGTEFYAIYEHKVHRDEEVSDRSTIWKSLKEQVELFYTCESLNRIYH